MPQVYPDILLPKSNYKIISCDLDEEYLLRYFDRKHIDEAIVDDSGKVTTDRVCSPKEHIYDLSTCLLGHYKIEFTKIEFTVAGKALFNDYCPADLEGDTPVHPEHYTINDLRSYWGVKIGLLTGIPVKINLSGKDVHARSYVKHTPTKANFWHYSLLWMIEGKSVAEYANFDQKVINKIATKIGTTARHTIINFAKVNLADRPGLELECFTKN